MPYEEITAKIYNDNRQLVLANVWGHMAPKKNKTYPGRIIFAAGCFDSGDLNPVALTCEFKGLSSSPWFYDCLNEFLMTHASEQRDKKMSLEGKVYIFEGTFRNYVFKGEVRQLALMDGARGLIEQ